MPAIITPGLIGTTIEKEVNAISILIAYKKLWKSIYSDNTNNDIIIITIITTNNSNNNKITTKIISKSK